MCARARGSAIGGRVFAPLPAWGSKGAQAPGAPQTRLALLARAMLPQLWASGLFPLFLAGLAQPTQKMKVSVPSATQRAAAAEDWPGVRAREDFSLVLSKARTRLLSSADPGGRSSETRLREAHSLTRTFSAPGGRGAAGRRRAQAAVVLAPLPLPLL